MGIMGVLNKKDLASTSLRKTALEIVEAGYKAINIENVFESYIRRKGNFLILKGRKINLADFKNIYVVGMGKGSFESAKVLEKILGDKIKDGAVIDVTGGKLKHIKSLVGTHPIPSKVNILATNKIIKILKGADKDDLVIVLVFGGGSALACKPGNHLTCDDLQLVTKHLFKVGSRIHDINVLRKHLSLIHGGHLSTYAYPAKVISLITSDVPGNNFFVVASGPTVFDTTTIHDAKTVAKKHRLFDIKFVETPKEVKYFHNVENILCVSNIEAVDAMAKKAKSLGFKPVLYSLQIEGEARDTGKRLASLLDKKTAVIAAGETTVTIKGKGKGGRNQEVVLGSLPFLPKDSVIVSFASDGWDHSDAAGAIADDSTLKTAKKLKLSSKTYLSNNDAYNYFKKLGDLVFADKKSANVSDLMLIIRK